MNEIVKKEKKMINNNEKPRIGLLGLMTDGYEGVFPGILERQNRFAGKIKERMEPYAQVSYAGIGVNQNKIGEVVRQYQELDGIFIVLLAYSQGAWLLRAMKDNRVPVAVAVIQSDDAVETHFEELDLTVNQGIHGAQDNCNVLMRLGIPYQVFAGTLESTEFTEFTANFASAARARTALRTMRVAVWGRMMGMGDILTDEMALFEKLGIEICHETLGSISKRMDQILSEEIEKECVGDERRFAVDPKMTPESHSIAVRMYLAFRDYLEEMGYEAFSAHFDLFAEDGRFRQLPLYAASRLMADGYGYAAEGDLVCAAMVRMAHLLSGNPASFTEMYMMDQKSQSILFCHAGESNYATAAPGSEVKLIDRYLGEGGLENPPTVIYQPQSGTATIFTMVSVKGEKFRIVAARGELLEKQDLPKCEMPYFFFLPESGVKNCIEGWLKNGGTHHEVICRGDMTARLSMLCDMLGIEYREV